MIVLVAVNENGVRIGESHPRVRLTDGEVELIRLLHEDEHEPVGYRRLAAIFEVSKRTIRDICAYRRRAETVAAWVEPRQLQRQRKKAVRISAERVVTLQSLKKELRDGCWSFDNTGDIQQDL